MRRHYFELLIRTISRLLISSPPSKVGRVPKAIALHVFVSNLNHQLRSQRLPRQIFSMTPATLRARHALTEIVTRPLFPRMRFERVLAIRFKKLDQFDSFLIGKTRTHANV